MEREIFGISGQAFKPQFDSHSNPSWSSLASGEKQHIFQSQKSKKFKISLLGYNLSTFLKNLCLLILTTNLSLSGFKEE